jgi:hypothetical protein
VASCKWNPARLGTLSSGHFEAEQGFAMKAPWILSTAAVAAGHLLIAGALAAPLAGIGMTAPARADLVRVQATQPPEAHGDRMSRLRQHRSILQNALRPSRRAGPAEPPVPPARALRPQEPMISTAPTPSQPAGAGQGGVTCEAAARIVADFGFSNIGSSDCSGDLYRFSAMRDGTTYAIGITAATGEITEVSRQ